MHDMETRAVLQSWHYSDIFASDICCSTVSVGVGMSDSDYVSRVLLCSARVQTNLAQHLCNHREAPVREMQNIPHKHRKNHNYELETLNTYIFWEAQRLSMDVHSPTKLLMAGTKNGVGFLHDTSTVTESNHLSTQKINLHVRVLSQKKSVSESKQV